MTGATVEGVTGTDNIPLMIKKHLLLLQTLNRNRESAFLEDR